MDEAPASVSSDDSAMAKLVARVHNEILERSEQIEPGDLARLRRLVEAAAPLCT